MKHCFCVLLIAQVWAGQLFAQTTIELIVQPGAHPVGKVDAFDLSQQVVHSVDYRDTLRFEFAKTNVDCYNFRYHVNGEMLRQQIWLDSGHIQIRAHLTERELVIDTVLNSPMYYFVKKFQSESQQFAKDTLMFNNYLLSTFIEQDRNPFSLAVAQSFVTYNQNNRVRLLGFKPFFDAQGDKFKWFLLYPGLAKQLEMAAAGPTSLNLAQYTFFDRKQQMVKLALTGAKYYVLDYWFLACAPCVADHREVKKNHELLTQNQVEVIGISTDYDNPEKWLAYLEKHQYNWPNYRQAKRSGLINQLGIGIYPTYLVLDGQGKLLGIYHAFSQVKERLKLNN
ncbi:MAG: TlpA family protein disulfide reductase [Bernardetiaceae bacterium]|jgi:peroxiredoxin|nr:TlpA family protein disulfide reductase [Bernardetiaceae bacterium]